MNNDDLSLEMKRLTIRLDEQFNEPGLVRVHLPNPPFDDAYATIDPDRQSQYPSANRNALHLRGCAEGHTPAAILSAAALYKDRGVETYFVHLSPGPDIGAMRRIIKGLGMKRFGGTGYPVLIRECSEPAAYSTEFEIREVEADGMSGLAGQLVNTIGPRLPEGFLSTSGKPGFHHFAAFDGSLPVAIGALYVFGEMGYLMSAATAESHRHRGAQQALIAHRIEKAKSYGCTYFTSQTLYMLKSSLSNLLNADFREAYAKEVYHPVTSQLG